MSPSEPKSIDTKSSFETLFADLLCSIVAGSSDMVSIIAKELTKRCEKLADSHMKRFSHKAIFWSTENFAMNRKTRVVQEE